MMFKETKSRSTSKSVSWRIIAFLNSWFILVVGLTDIPLWNALIMNLTGIYFSIYTKEFGIILTMGDTLKNLNKYPKVRDIPFTKRT